MRSPNEMASSKTLASDSVIRDTLGKLESQFFAALEDYGGSLLADFHSSWADFEAQLQSLYQDLTMETLDDIAKFATVMVTVSHSLADESSSLDAIERFKSNLKHEVAASSQPKPSNPTPFAARYIDESLHWLRQNLHNPYPSRSVRSNIAKQSKSLLKDVDAWFLDIRKRIGWSQMRHTRFSNRKTDIVNAATRFFTGSDPHRPLDSIVESEFASIAATVDQLYYEKCAGSTLAAHLDEAVRDLTPDLREFFSKSRRVARRHPYPTPELSPSLLCKTLATPEPPPFELPPASTSIQRKKRSRSPSTECPTDVEAEQTRPTKRQRLSPSPTLHTPGTSCYPSPAASVVLNLTELRTEPPIAAEIGLVTHTGKRKRTLSDSGKARVPPSRESLSQPCTSSSSLPLSVNGILDRATFSPSIPSAVPEPNSDVFSPFDPFFAAFMSVGGPALDATPSPLPLLNIVDDVAPTNVHVEFDQSWLSSSANALAPSYDPYATGYNANFDNFGGNLYSGTVDPFNCPLWHGDPPLQPLASAPCPENSAMALAGQHDASLPSTTGLYHEYSPFPLSPTNLPHSDLRTDTDKARELEELEARCATLRSELAARR